MNSEFQRLLYDILREEIVERKSKKSTKTKKSLSKILSTSFGVHFNMSSAIHLNAENAIVQKHNET